MRAWPALLALAACHHAETRETADAAPALTVTPIIAPRDGGLSPAEIAQMLGEQRAGDGGVGGTLVEYFDATTKEIVAAEDSRRKPCGDFGTVPKCKVEIDWGPLRP